MNIDDIIVGKRHRSELGDIGSLAQSIDEIGLLHPVVVRPDGTLIAGQRRLAACRMLGWQDVPVTTIDIESILVGEYDENTLREDFTPSAAVAIWQDMESYQGQQPYGQPLPSNLDGSTTHKEPRQRAAKATGYGKTTLTKAKQVVESGDDRLIAEMDSTGRVSGVYRKLKVQRQAAAIATEPEPLPTGPFRVIVADPPWPYWKRASDPSHQGATPYPAMSIEDIKNLNVDNIATSDCILWLWTTNAHLPEAFGVVEAWGFTYKTMLTWVKNRMGTGDWLRGKTEHCLMAARGKPTVVLTNQTTVIEGPLREHSRKPDEFYAMVEKLCPGSKLDLFARTERDGWAAYGDETRRFLSD